MASELRRLLIGLGLMSLAGWVMAQQDKTPPSKIYSCTTSDGRRLTSDRPIPDCNAREQNVLRRDGSVLNTMPPSQSIEERADAEIRQRALEAQKAALADATRHDRNLMSRFRNKGMHDLARQAALDDLVKATEISQRRIKDLAKERKTLDQEAEFYKHKVLPPKLKQQIDVNEAAVEAQKLFIDQQEGERVRVNKRYDVELLRLQKLWAGAAPGSLGPPPSARDEVPAAPASAVKPKASSSAAH